MPWIRLTEVDSEIASKEWGTLVLPTHTITAVRWGVPASSPDLSENCTVLNMADNVEWGVLETPKEVHQLILEAERTSRAVDPPRDTRMTSPEQVAGLQRLIASDMAALKGDA